MCFAVHEDEYEEEGIQSGAVEGLEEEEVQSGEEDEDKELRSEEDDEDKELRSEEEDEIEELQVVLEEDEDGSFNLVLKEDIIMNKNKLKKHN